MDTFDGEVTVRRRRYASTATGFAVLDANDAEGDPVVLVGPLIHLEDRERAHIRGTWVDDRRYGPQVKVAEARPLAPADRETLIAYLRRVKHVGARRAGRLVDEHGSAEVLDAIDADPQRTFAAIGLGAERANEAAASWNGLRALRQLHLLLAPHGLAYLVTRLHEHYGQTAYRQVIEQPYELTSVFGVGFLIADRIAHVAGATDPGARARAGALHTLTEAERSGSTCLPAPALERALTALLGNAPPQGLLAQMVQDGDLVGEGGWLYRPPTAALESELAGRVAAMLRASANDTLAGVELAAVPGLTAEQADGLARTFTHRLSVITGGPGTGKTASIRAIATQAATAGVRLLLLAPTGRAAIRMTESSGVRASTVHSALGWIPGEGPTHDEQDPLAAQLIVLDEASMANLELLVALLRAVREDAHVVLVGDADQLAPVGAGKPFAELADADGVPTTRLTHIFRQAAGSMIVQAAHAIRRGQPPNLQPASGMRRDLFLIERPDPRAAREEIVSLVSQRLPAHYGIDPVSDIQVFVPVYRGELGIDTLNLALRRALNADGVAVRGDRLRIGDKVMMTGRNLHELGLMNGTMLRVLDEIDSSGDDEGALLLGGDEGVFRLSPEQADRLQLAYACSVHRGQGIELPVAVIVAHPAAGAFFLRREMLYTAITRARMATVIVGMRDVLARAARTADTGQRHSRLAERLAHAQAR